jgi:dipeptidyl aminopeptidase/acylaminoacyl peptidase
MNPKRINLLRIISIVLALSASTLGCRTLFGDSTPKQDQISETITLEAATAVPQTGQNAVTPVIEMTEISAQSLTGLAASGPWLAIASTDGLWAVNQDGSALTRLSTLTPYSPRKIIDSIAPSGGHIAYVSAEDPEIYSKPALHFISLPDGADQTITQLTSPSTEPSPDFSIGESNFEAARAITYTRNPIWSPDGMKLAFVGARDGRDADLYVLDMATGQITRLSDEVSQAYSPSWSPDGKNIAFLSVESFGTGAGFAMTGAWIASADKPGAKSLYPVTNSSIEVLVGWSDPENIMVYTWGAVEGTNRLRRVNIKTGSEEVVIDKCFQDALMNPDTGDVWISGIDPQYYSCSIGKGLYLLMAGSDDPVQILEEDMGIISYDPNNYYPVTANTYGKGSVIVSVDANYIFNSPVKSSEVQNASINGVIAWANPYKQEPGVWIERLSKDEKQKIFDAPAEMPVLNAHGDLFFISNGQLYFAQQPSYDAPVSLGNVTGSYPNSAWVQP